MAAKVITERCSPVMSPEDMQRAVVEIAGGSGHGFIKAAAAALDVTPRTINNALRGSITAPFSRKVRAKLKEIEHRAEKSIFGGAGTWSIGHVSDRQTGNSVIDETIVTHLRTPVFILHIAMIRGRDEDGSEIWEEAVRWMEEPSSEEIRSSLVEEAREKAKSSIYARLKVVADRIVREKKEYTLRIAGHLSVEEIKALSLTRLSAEARVALRKNPDGSRATLHDCMRDLEQQLAEVSAKVNGAQSYDAMRLGYLRATHRMMLTALQELGTSDHAAHMAEVAYSMIPQADYRNERGQREAMQDAKEMREDLEKLVIGLDD